MIHNTNQQWSPEVFIPLQQQEQLIIALKQSQKDKHRINWRKIAKKLNDNFGLNKTSRECKIHYEKHIKVLAQPNLTTQWTSQELNILMLSYIQHGSSWSRIVQNLSTKNDSIVKNKFHNQVRKTLRFIWEKEKKGSNQPQKKLSYEVIIIILDLSNQLEKWLESKKVIWSQEAMIFRFKRDFLRLCFNRQIFSEQEVLEIIKLLRNISAKLKSHGLFKVKNRKHWKLTEACVKNISQIQNLAFENTEQISQTFESRTIKRSDKTKQNQCPGYYPQNMERQRNQINECQLFDLAGLVLYKQNNSEMRVLQIEIKDILGEDMFREFEMEREEFSKLMN